MPGFNLARWVEQSEQSEQFAIPGSDRDVVAIGDMEIGYYIAERGGRFVVETTSRSTVRVLLGSFATEDQAKTFLIAVIGRIEFRPGQPELGPDRFEERPDDGVIRVRGAEFAWSLTGRVHARLFERVADIRPDRLATWYNSRKGKPLFA